MQAAPETDNDDDRYDETPGDHDTRCTFNALREIAAADPEERAGGFESLFCCAYSGPRVLRAHARAVLARHGYRWGGEPVSNDPVLASVLADWAMDGVL